MIPKTLEHSFDLQGGYVFAHIELKIPLLRVSVFRLSLHLKEDAPPQDTLKRLSFRQ